MTILFGKDLSKPLWWQREEAHRAFNDLADTVLQECRNHRWDLVSVGQSPAWIAHIVEAKTRGQDLRVTLLPFSGHNNKLYADDVYREDNKIPNIAAYRNFLSSQGLSPEAIIERRKTSGKITAFLDVVDTSESLAEFVYIIARWAHEKGMLGEFKKSIDVVAIDSIFSPAKTLHYPSLRASFDPVGIRSNLTRMLLRGTSSNDRLVPKYPADKWNHPPRHCMKFTTFLAKQFFSKPDFVNQRPLCVTLGGKLRLLEWRR